MGVLIKIRMLCCFFKTEIDSGSLGNTFFWIEVPLHLSLRQQVWYNRFKGRDTRTPTHQLNFLDHKTNFFQKSLNGQFEPNLNHKGFDQGLGERNLQILRFHFIDENGFFQLTQDNSRFLDPI